MRTPRILILFFFLLSCFFILVRFFATSSHQPRSSRFRGQDRSDGPSVFGFMYYNTPFSLFPPNAAISLTDDNSTSFAARPAAFGPKLAPRGLSGQLWVGSGFVEDTLDGDGELGCSDVLARARTSTIKWIKPLPPHVAAAANPNSSRDRRDVLPLDASTGDVGAAGDAKPRQRKPASAADPADLLPDSGGRHDPVAGASSSSSSHADIQSIQEAAEIEGKVVLLMRGGCGFLDKVMWAQRRGAIAVIVGDNQKGGPLIQMFAHGDEVENVTIPSVFTARTTAQLLSSLTQPGSFIEDFLDENGEPVLKVQQGVRPNRKKSQDQGSTTAAHPAKKPSSSAKFRRSTSSQEFEPLAKRNGKPGLASRVFGWKQPPRVVDTKSRPPSSGKLDWVLVDDWNDEADNMIMDGLHKDKKQVQSKASESLSDNFVIGVQDWRDPDLVDTSATATDKQKNPDKKAGQKGGPDGKDAKLASNEANKPKGGSITPGSGQYNRERVPTKPAAEVDKSEAQGSGHGLMSKLFGDDADGATLAEAADRGEHITPPIPGIPGDPKGEPHEGLWVTITPTSSASPFFDTLLVLVISPLVTLTIVYALLILRSRIRRRRWRAPKSVIDQLPVRTYHTVAATPGASPRLPSPSSTSATTPLLQQQQTSQPQHGPARPRPRSRTTTGIPESDGLLGPDSAVSLPRSRSRAGHRAEHEKGAGSFSAEWKKYMGRQVECVVCLEEYVDGVSRVMSLPCGHEFHADCITPWLTTRRRTCPICKGDVVRSLAHGSSSNPRYEPFDDDSDDETEAEGSGSRSSRRDADLERGILSLESRESGPSRRQDGFFTNFFSSFGSRSQSRTPPPEGRDR